MAITSTLTTSFKTELLTGTHNFTNSSGDTFKLALFTSSATLGAATTAFQLLMKFLVLVTLQVEELLLTLLRQLMELLRLQILQI